MGLRDALFGRTTQAQPKLDNLFALSTGALTLESELDLVSSGQAGLCFKAGSGESTITTDAPLSANMVAMADPEPDNVPREPAPVTIAVRPFSRPSRAISGTSSGRLFSTFS